MKIAFWTIHSSTKRQRLSFLHKMNPSSTSHAPNVPVQDGSIRSVCQPAWQRPDEEASLCARKVQSGESALEV
jgi:hypothetical protein